MGNGTSTSPSTRTARRTGVNDASGTFLVRRGWGGGREFRPRFTIDTLTGASASGAVPAGRPQTFTSPSGKASYTTPAGTIPLDPTFLDTRVALAGNMVQPLGRLRRSTSACRSRVNGTLHTGVNANYTRDFNERRTTFTLGGVAQDTIDPEGSAYAPGADVASGDLQQQRPEATMTRR